MKRLYFNEFERFAAAWLRDLWPEATVDERSITDVASKDLAGFERVHLFGGIGGWEYALELAGWPARRPVWTGSCPCQPFSSAGRRKGTEDERHLWPEMLRLIRECRPEIVFGEQVASAEVVGTELEASFIDAVQTGRFARANKLAKRLAQSRNFHFHHRWISGVRADLEAAGYAMRWKILGAHSVGAPHIRQRIYWVAQPKGERHRPESISGSDRKSKAEGRFVLPGGHGAARRLAESGQQSSRDVVAGSGLGADPVASERGTEEIGESGRRRLDRGVVDSEVNGASDSKQERESDAERAGPDSGLVQPNGDGRESGQSSTEAARHGGSALAASSWGDFYLVPCLDGKARRVGSGLQPLAHGVPARVGRLRGYGNAIVPQAAAAFVRAVLRAAS